ncbi:hypothetical protein JOD03_002386 [Chryseomicrobium aureum]|uniref:hypothetical protein n=1 Tax=Chryseomicrobium aureum TaxID=1441723 RepID=UPI001957FAA1|nr:hypothetical protein [Chryseomicrobium aureum]MBM7707439.1 hypothetical protein [Chryseomicrobium aureum]
MMNVYTMHQSVKAHQDSVQFLAQQRLTNQTAAHSKKPSWTQWFSIKSKRTA